MSELLCQNLALYEEVKEIRPEVLGFSATFSETVFEGTFSGASFLRNLCDNSVPSHDVTSQ